MTLFENMLDDFLYAYRWTLESLGSLEPRQSALEDGFEVEEEKEENDQLDGLEDDAGASKLVFSFLF
jgi:hypothetical protein